MSLARHLTTEEMDRLFGPDRWPADDAAFTLRYISEPPMVRINVFVRGRGDRRPVYCGSILRRAVNA